jgi:hypothetical protein
MMVSFVNNVVVVVVIDEIERNEKRDIFFHASPKKTVYSIYLGMARGAHKSGIIE